MGEDINLREQSMTGLAVTISWKYQTSDDLENEIYML